MDERGCFDLTKEQHDHLRALWAEEATRELLDVCVDQMLEYTRNKIFTSVNTVDELNMLKAQIEGLLSFFAILKTTALGNQASNNTGMPNLI